MLRVGTKSSRRGKYSWKERGRVEGVEEIGVDRVTTVDEGVFGLLREALGGKGSGESAA